MAITRNSAHCDECNTEIVSTHRHDYRSCKCGAIAVDGGRAYLRRLWTEGKPWTDTSIHTRDENVEDKEYDREGNLGTYERDCA